MELAKRGVHHPLTISELVFGAKCCNKVYMKEISEIFSPKLVLQVLACMEAAEADTSTEST